MAKVLDGENYQGILYAFGYYNDNQEWVNYSDPQIITDSGTVGARGTVGYKEPALVDIDESYNQIVSLNNLKKEYNEMIKSVSKYGGFFVGRYETSLNGDTVASKPNTSPMSASDDNQMWYGLYAKQKDFTLSSDILQSSMIWGSQYDAMLNWMLTGNEKQFVVAVDRGNHSGHSANTGGQGNTDKINNVYDLEGNLLEWTLEADAESSTARVIRGDCFYGFSQPMGSRYINMYFPSTETDSVLGSRMSLYIK